MTAAALLVAGIGLSADAQLFLEDFDDGAAAGRWSAPVVDAENGALDGTVDFAFDYSTVGIPSAPNSSGGSTTGLFMEVNVVDDGPIDEGVSVGTTSSVATIPSGDFALKMDVWYEVDFNASGTTEYGIFGIHASGANFPADPSVNDDIPFRFGLSDGDGLAFALTGDGGAADDIYLFEDAGNADAGSQAGLGSLDSIPFGSIPGVVTGAGDPNDPLGLNGFGPTSGGWVDITVESSAGIISFQLNGFELGTFDNTGGAFTGGTILLGYNDAFNSSQNTGPGAQAHYIVFDNVRLIPEPTSAMLGLLAAFGVSVARRR